MKKSVAYKKIVYVYSTISSIVNEVIRTISIYFYEKISSAQKCKSTKNQLTKQNKQMTNNRGNDFSRTKTSKRVKIVCFAFLEKIEIVLITSLPILLTCTPINPPIENLFAHAYVHDKSEGVFT